MKNIRHALPENERQKVSVALEQVMLDMLDLAIVAKQAHWAVIGNEFPRIHEQTDELAAAYHETVDELGERMLALGILPNGQVKNLAASSRVDPLPDGFIGSEEMVTHLADRIAAVAGRARKAQESMEADPVSEDMIITLVGELEKTVWMLQAQES